jgi:hypothetical protein
MLDSYETNSKVWQRKQVSDKTEIFNPRKAGLCRALVQVLNDIRLTRCPADILSNSHPKGTKCEETVEMAVLFETLGPTSSAGWKCLRVSALQLPTR